MQAELLKYCDKSFIVLTNNLCEVNRACSIESVHKLRLTIKKLNALFRILNDIREIHSFRKELKLIDQIYTSAAQLRDNQVQVGLLKEYQDRAGSEVAFVVESLKIDQKITKKTLSIKVNRFNPFDLVLLNQRIDNTIELLSDSSIEFILQEKESEIFNKISQIIKNNPDEKGLHHIRIMIKDLIYTLSIIKIGKGKSSFDFLAITDLKKIQTTIGEWHDLQGLFDYVNRVHDGLTNLIKILDIDRVTKRMFVSDELRMFGEKYLY